MIYLPKSDLSFLSFLPPFTYFRDSQLARSGVLSRLLLWLLLAEHLHRHHAHQRAVRDHQHLSDSEAEFDHRYDTILVTTTICSLYCLVVLLSNCMPFVCFVLSTPDWQAYQTFTLRWAVRYRFYWKPSSSCPRVSCLRCCVPWAGW